ncbi:hypothetical protein [Piscinibacter terrae]|nr:hypothetical protein [Albitalea terrae]
MNFKTSIRALIAACAAIGFAALCHAADVPAASAGAPRDGQHDFDFNLGVWKTHIKRNMTPLTGRTELVEMHGTVRVRPVWNGKGMLEEIEADGPRGHWQAMTLFLYNPQSRQWSMSFANSANGKLDVPMIGTYAGGRIELYQQDNVGGRSIFVRGTWSDITPTSHSYQEDYSDDGGKTWEPSFTARLTLERAAL